MSNSLIITHDLLLARNACFYWRDVFNELHPEGLDLAPFFSADRGEVKEAWQKLLASPLRQTLHWAWREGLLPPMPEFVRGDLENADLEDADFRYADLSNADLEGACLKDAMFYSANLEDALLRNANLQNADLQYARLQGANLDGADLRDADLCDVDLTLCGIEGTQFEGAMYSERTRFPEGFDPAEHGMEYYSF